MPPIVVPLSFHMIAPYAAKPGTINSPAPTGPKIMPTKITSINRAAIRTQNPARGSVALGTRGTALGVGV
jgi:hypothetical protein